MRPEIVLTVLLLGGCYTYRPLNTPAPSPGTRVSAELTGDGARELSGQVGPEIEHVEGDVVAVDSGRVDIAVRQVETIRGIQADWKGEKVTIPRAAVAGWQERKLSVGGTWFLGGLVAGGLYAMYRLLGGPGLISGNGGDSGPSGGAR
jgi:hypothetical protein